MLYSSPSLAPLNLFRVERPEARSLGKLLVSRAGSVHTQVFAADKSNQMRLQCGLWFYAATCLACLVTLRKNMPARSGERAELTGLGWHT